MASLNAGHGLIATVVRGDEVLARHFQVEPEKQRGFPARRSGTADAVADLVSFCDAGGWKVRAISTPNTILRDLDGAREHRGDADVAATAFPESRILPFRRDLIERPV